MDKKEFGKRLHKLMREKGMHQAELARASGLARNNVSTYIGARSWPSAESLDKLARALGMTAEELLPEHKVLPVRGEMPADLELRVDPATPDMAHLSIRRFMPLVLASQIIALITSPASPPRSGPPAPSSTQP